MNELKYQMKIILVIFNTTLSNCAMTYYITIKPMFVNTPITKTSNVIDTSLIILYIVFLLYVFNNKRKQGVVQKLSYYMQQPLGKLLAALICSIMLVKIVFYFFGNLFYIA